MDLTETLLYKMIGNKMNLAAIYIEVAKYGFKTVALPDRDLALAKAQFMYAEARRLMKELPAEKQAALARRMKELSDNLNEIARLEAPPNEQAKAQGNS